MMQHRLLPVAASLAVIFLGGAVPAQAEGGYKLLQPKSEWSFEGPLGTYDKAALRRGFQVYNEVCSTCHALVHLRYGDLDGLGYTADEIKAIAAQKQVTDGPNDQGEMYQRPARASDFFARPFPNEQAARYSNNGAVPADLSLVVKAREGGPDYVFSLLNGYKEPPAGVKLGAGMNYNAYFPGHQTAMPQPLADGAVTYADGTRADLEQMAQDVTTFLTWAAEPNLEARHRMGLQVIGFLILLTGVFYVLKRRIWSKVH